jgi:hypothetical protein
MTQVFVPDERRLEEPVGLAHGEPVIRRLIGHTGCVARDAT